MIFLLAILGLLTFAQPAAAQNCPDVKSGIGANQKPQNVGRDIIGQSLDDIVAQGWIVIAVYEDYPPYSYSEGGELKGVDIDVGRLIADELGVEARFLVRSADENVDADLRNNVWRGPVVGGPVANVMLHVPDDRVLACRNEQVVLNGAYFTEKIAIAYDKSKYPDGGPSPAYFRYDKVGVENDTISDFYLSGLARGQVLPNVQRYADYTKAMAELRAGNIPSVMGPIGELKNGLTDGFALHTPPLPGLARASWTLGVAVRHNWRPLSYAIDDILVTAVSDGKIDHIFKQHGLSYVPPEF